MIRLAVGLALLILALAVPPASATTTASALSFSLAMPNIAVAPEAGSMASAGDWIKVTGAGTFDPVAGTVSAGGTFVHYTAGGTVHCKGTWKATALTGWTDFGGNRTGQHGGVVSLAVTHYCSTMRMVHTGVPMTVTSTLNAPSDSYVEGTTMGEFTEPAGGGVGISGR